MASNCAICIIITLSLIITDLRTEFVGKFRRASMLQHQEEINAAKFSGPPSGLPVKRVNVHGNRLLLRQMFLEPIIRPPPSRGNNESLLPEARSGEVGKREQQKQAEEEGDCTVRQRMNSRRHKRQGCGCGGGRGCCGGGGCGGCGNGGCNQQRNTGSGTYQVPAPQPHIQQYSNFPSKQPQPASVQYRPQPPTTYPQLSQQQQIPIGGSNSAATRVNYERQPFPAPGPLLTDRKPSYTTAPQQQREPNRDQSQGPHHAGYAKVPPVQYARQQYPLPECYTDDSNFMCCNAQLEETIHKAFQHLIDTNPDFHRCSIQKISNTVQSFAERCFNTTFEVVTGLTDYASKNHFFSNYICKVEREGRYILAYASPRWDLETKSSESAEEYASASYATRPRGGGGGGPSGGRTTTPMSPRSQTKSNYVFRI